MGKYHVHVLYTLLCGQKRRKKHKVMLFMGQKKEKNIKLRLDGHAK
jgi:hypothetical protein